MVVSSPSCPTELLPQHDTAPVRLSAQACLKPAASCAASATPTTSTGALLFLVLPSPSWPMELSPQQWTVMSFLRAQVQRSPAWISATSVSPSTAAGETTTWALDAGRPTCPLSLPPQQAAAPPRRTRQVCDLPPAMLAQSSTPGIW